MWYYRFIVFGSSFFVSCSEKREITVCDCAKINIKIVHDPLSDLNSFTKELIEKEFGEEYLVCEEIIRDWKLNFQSVGKEKQVEMMKKLRSCVIYDVLTDPVMRDK